MPLDIMLFVLLHFIRGRRVICERKSSYYLLKIEYIPPISLTRVNYTNHNYNSNLEIRKLK